jgi:Zn-dependent peptidase ImmA (M78 family)
MKVSTMKNMFRIAGQEGIDIEWQEFIPPIRGIYWAPDGIPPVIWLDKTLIKNTRLLRCVMAEELGHHFTLDRGDCLCSIYFNYRDRLAVSRAEYRALRWAAKYLMPIDKLNQVIKSGMTRTWELAEHFDVTETIVRFRLGLPDLAFPG